MYALGPIYTYTHLKEFLGWYILACAFTDQSLPLQVDVTQTLLELELTLRNFMWKRP